MMRLFISNSISTRIKPFMRVIAFISTSTLVAFILILVPLFSQAQISDPGNPDAPIDGGLSILIAAAVGYGVKEYRKSRSGKQD